MRDRGMPAKLQERRPIQGLYLRPLPEGGRRRHSRRLEMEQAGTQGVRQAMERQNPAIALCHTAGQRAGLHRALDSCQSRLHAVCPGRPDQTGDGGLAPLSLNRDQLLKAHVYRVQALRYPHQSQRVCVFSRNFFSIGCVGTNATRMVIRVIHLFHFLPQFQKTGTGARARQRPKPSAVDALDHNRPFGADPPPRTRRDDGRSGRPWSRLSMISAVQNADACWLRGSALC